MRLLSLLTYLLSKCVARQVLTLVCHSVERASLRRGKQAMPISGAQIIVPVERLFALSTWIYIFVADLREFRLSQRKWLDQHRTWPVLQYCSATSVLWTYTYQCVDIDWAKGNESRLFYSTTLAYCCVVIQKSASCRFSVAMLYAFISSVFFGYWSSQRVNLLLVVLGNVRMRL